MQVLTQQDLPKVAGGEASTCTYANQSYSSGAVVSVGGGWGQTCLSGGSWSQIFRLQ